MSYIIPSYVYYVPHPSTEAAENADYFMSLLVPEIEANTTIPSVQCFAIFGINDDFNFEGFETVIAAISVDAVGFDDINVNSSPLEYMITDREGK